MAVEQENIFLVLVMNFALSNAHCWWRHWDGDLGFILFLHTYYCFCHNINVGLTLA